MTTTSDKGVPNVRRVAGDATRSAASLEMLAAAGASAEEKADLFWRSAARFYRLPQFL